jgi:uncharacterized protein YndB with AHSA1/START domain
MTDANPATRSVVLEREIPHPTEKIWRALTQGPLLEEWLMKNDFQAKVGCNFEFRAQPTLHWDGVVHCEVLIVEPNKRLVYTWCAAGATGLATVVTWTLTPTTNGTFVRMEQSGFRPEDEGGYQGASHGWRRFVRNLELVVERLT